MSKPKSTAKSTAKTASNGHAAKTQITAPEPPPGFVRLPVDPFWWSEERELHGAIFDVEMAEGPKGEPVQSVVIVTSARTHAVDNWGDAIETEPNDVVRLYQPALLKLGRMASDPESVHNVVIQCVQDRGRKRYFVAVSAEHVPRAGFTPRAPRRPVATATP